MLDIIDSLQRLRTAAMAHNPSDYEQQGFMDKIQTWAPIDIRYVEETFPDADRSIHRRLGQAISWRRAILGNDCSASGDLAPSEAIRAITFEIELLFGPREATAETDDIGSGDSEDLSDDSSPKTASNRLFLGEPLRRCPVCKAEEHDTEDFP